MGLTLALRLAELGREVTVFESEPEPGGLASSASFGDLTWDRFYHVISAEDKQLISLVKQLDLDDSLKFKKVRTGLHIGGGLRSLSSPFELLMCRQIPVSAKFGLARAVLAATKFAAKEQLDKETAESWLLRHSGKAAFEAIWRPLLRSKLGEQADNASALFIYSILRRLYVDSGRSSGQFGYLAGGYQSLLESWIHRLKALGVEFRCNCPVTRVSRSQRGLLVTTNQSTDDFDQAVLTTPGPHSARMIEDLLPHIAHQLEAHHYLGVVCVSLLCHQPVTPFYISNLTEPAVITGIVEMTNLVSEPRFGNRSLIYLPQYTDSNDPLFNEPNDRIVSQFLKSLGDIRPGFDVRHVISANVHRARHVLVFPAVNRLNEQVSVDTDVPGLFIVNASQIMSGALTVNETISHAHNCLPLLLRKNTQSNDGGKRAAWWAQAEPYQDQITRIDRENFVLELPKPIEQVAAGQVLDVGCGPGLLAELFTSHPGNYLGIDISARAIEIARSRFADKPQFQFVQLDPSDPTDFGAVHNMEFDWIICYSVIQYLKNENDLARLLTQLRIHLAKDGYLFIGDIPIRWRPLAEVLRLIRYSVQYRCFLSTSAAVVKRSLNSLRDPEILSTPVLFSPDRFCEIAQACGFQVTIQNSRSRPKGNRFNAICCVTSTDQAIET